MKEKEKFKLIGSYQPPMAAVLILLVVVFSKPENWTVYLALFLLLGSVVLNYPGGRFYDRNGVKLRKAGNIGINSVLVLTIGKYRGPMWSLFLFTPFFTALKGTRFETLVEKEEFKEN